MKKILMIVSAVVIAAAIAAGSFYGGMAYQRNQANSIRDTFLRSRGLEGFDPAAGGFPGDGQGSARQGRFFMGGGTSGQVKSIDGNTLTISTPQNETKVTLSDETTIQMTTEGTLADLQPGQQVMVTGERDDNGNVTATQVLILNISLPAPEAAP